MMELTDYDTIRDVLARHGFHFSKSLGQNFLTAAWVPERIAEEAGLDEDTGVLEIGPGIGCLTAELSRRAGKVLAVELDRKLMPVLEETLSGCGNTEVLFGDVLKQDLPALAREYFPGMRAVVCANLPYNVTGPVLTRLLEAECFETVTVMVQREVARRICADPGTPEYSAFTVLCAWHCRREILFDVGPECFVPQPRVTSSVICLTRLAERPARVTDEALFFRVVRAAFGQRRKTLENALAAGFPELPKAALADAVRQSGTCPGIRGEMLGINDFAQISDCIRGVLRR